MSGNDRDHDPAERYAELSPKTREWLESRRPEDWNRLDDALVFFERARTNGRFLLWLIGSIIGVVIATATFGDQIIRILNYIKGGK